jgi:hypothetical protein
MGNLRVFPISQRDYRKNSSYGIVLSYWRSLDHPKNFLKCALDAFSQFSNELQPSQLAPSRLREIALTLNSLLEIIPWILSWGKIVKW